MVFCHILESSLNVALPSFLYELLYKYDLIISLNYDILDL